MVNYKEKLKGHKLQLQSKRNYGVTIRTIDEIYEIFGNERAENIIEGLDKYFFILGIENV